MKILLSTFLSDLKRCLPGIETSSNPLLEGSDSFIFDGKNVYSFNNNILVSVPSKFPTDKVIAVKAKEFFDFLSSIKGNEVEINVIDEAIEITSGKLKANFNLNVVEEGGIFEYISEVLSNIEEWKDLPVDFMEGLNATLLPNNIMDMDGVFVKGNVLLATDRKRISKWELDLAIEDTFMISSSSIKELLKLNSIEKYSTDEAWVYFKDKSDTIFSIRKMNHEFFPYDKALEIIKMNKKEEGDFENEWSNELIDILKRAEIFSREEEIVLFKIRNEEVFIEAKSNFGSFSESLKMKKSFEDDISFDLWFFPQMIINGFKKSVKFYIKSYHDTYVIVFYSDKFMMIVSSVKKV